MNYCLDIRCSAIVDELVSLDYREIAHLKKLAANLFAFDESAYESTRCRDLYDQTMVLCEDPKFLSRSWSESHVLLSHRLSLRNAASKFENSWDLLEKNVPGLYVKHYLEGPFSQIWIVMDSDFYVARCNLLGKEVGDGYKKTVPVF